MYGPVHHLENVDGNPKRLRLACGKFEWDSPASTELVDNRTKVCEVTCPECLRVMAERAGMDKEDITRR